MKIFIHEYFTCGGLLNKDKGAEPLDEGIAMFRSAMADFQQAPGVEPCAIIDYRLQDTLKETQGIAPIRENYFENFSEALDGCAEALVIAPETDGALEQLTGMVEASNTANLGSGVEAIRATADKLVFANKMRDARIPHPRAAPLETGLDPHRFFNGEYILKPVKGCGSVGVTRRAGRPEPCSGFMAQEFVSGAPMSLSVISGQDRLAVVSVNRQKISGDADIKYSGGEITDVRPDDELVDMATRIHEAIPGLRGYWGIDYIQSAQGPVVIEVNPRLTTSYCALRYALGLNPAQMILRAVQDDATPLVSRRKTVRFNRDGTLE